VGTTDRVMMSTFFANQRENLAAVALVVMTLVVFGPVIGFDYVTIDDDSYVTGNPHVRDGLSGDSVLWAFSTFYFSNWHPLTWLSHMADCQLFGVKPGPHHFVNLLFHTINVLLLFWMLKGMTGALWRSAFVAALFALHPLHIESVAWISERKDLLSGLFWMLTLMAYTEYVRKPGWTRYAAVVALFAAGLMAKPMIVTLPCVLLLLDFWPLNRVRNEDSSFGRTFWVLVREKFPLFVLSAVSSVITILAQRSGEAVASTDLMTFGIRFENAVVSYAKYIGKTFYPTNLAIPYVHPGATLTLVQAGGAVLLLVVVIAAVIVLARRSPYLLVGWLWFIGMLVPVIGIVQVGSQGMADRYTYLPLIGLFIMVAWGVEQASRNSRALRGVVTVAALVCLVVLAVCCRAQLHYWRNGITLFEHSLRVDDKNPPAHNNLGVALMAEGEHGRAAEHFKRALELSPGNVDALNNRGGAMIALGRYAEAAEVLTQVLESTPDDASAHSNLGVALYFQGKFEEAAKQLKRALELDPHCTIALPLLQEIQNRSSQQKTP